ncbi:MAG: DUF362 domain-containing protein [Bacteroidales bacterium]|nr:DUF362 domain-containing protein [Candidatus Cacconaster equi]
MEKSKVYFTDFHTVAYGDGTAVKLKNLIKAAGIGNIDMDGKFVAIKMHFGEQGNLSFLRPNYARAVVDVVKELGGKPFLTDCNTMYPGSRKNALEHLYCAWENGFTPLTVGCPVIIGDGLKGTDDVAVPVKGGEYVKEALIGRAVMDADIIISLTHFKGHEETGFGGCLKNLGMGCGSRAGKKDQHSHGKAKINEDKCKGCRKCQKECANGGLVFLEDKKKMSVSPSCMGCGRCLGACNFDAIYFAEYNANEMLCRRIAEYTKAVIDGRPSFHISLVLDVSPNCDCHSENDVPILPDLGMFASFDPLALDWACVDACLAASPLPGGQLYNNIHKDGFVDLHDHFKNSTPESEWRACLEQAEKIGLGSREYELIKL